MASPSIPPTMRAWTFNRKGHPTETLKLTELPTPSPASLAPGDVLIKVSHVSLNIGLIVAFMLFPHLTSFPYIPELEFSGTVVAVGSAPPPELKVGDEVAGGRNAGSMFKYNGTLVEYLVSPGNQVVVKPANLPMAEASGLAGVGCTSIQAIEIAKLKKGDKVLITGASGGLGTMLVQCCRAVIGATGTIVATCSGPNIELVKGLGADEVIDYTVHSPIYSYLLQHHKDQPFNAIFDVAGDKALHANCPSYLTSDGWFMLLGEMKETGSPSWWGFFSFLIPAKLERFRPVLLGGVPRNHRMYNAIPDQKTLRRVMQMIEAGQIKGRMDSVWSMEDALKAYERSLSQRARGKVVIRVEK